jgi:hypothetical protein
MTRIGFAGQSSARGLPPVRQIAPIASSTQTPNRLVMSASSAL